MKKFNFFFLYLIVLKLLIPIGHLQAKSISGQLLALGDKVADYSDFVIYIVKPVPKPAKRTKPKTHKIIQIDKEFRPLVLGIRSGDKVDFENRDNLFHNVFSLDPINKFDLGLYKGKVKYKKDLSTPLKDKLSTTVTMKGNHRTKVFCNIHQSMQTSIYSFNHPYFTQPDRTGAFELPLPKGLKEATIRIEGEYIEGFIEKSVKLGSSLKVNFKPTANSAKLNELNHKDKDGNSYEEKSSEEDEYY